MGPISAPARDRHRRSRAGAVAYGAQRMPGLCRTPSRGARRCC